ncbi:carbohydrate kinase family protein [Candidatus Woesearchaeota archaeon]|nr:carbohydrate kinase family protein [Candidatus Woesearchaeota archaeon]
MYDMICVGSATVDCFVSTGNRLFQKAHKNYIHVPFGQKILVDDIKFETGGGATNTGVGFSRLGLKTAVISKMGLGTNSKRIVRELEKEKIDCSLVVRKQEARTGFSVVLDAKGKDRTILAFKGSNNNLRLNEVSKSKLKTKWFYFSSMMGSSFNVVESLSDYAVRNNINVAFNPSSYVAVKGTKYLRKILRACTILILNRGEACELLRKDYKTNIDILLKSLFMHVPRLVVVTDGEKGVYAFDGTVKYFLKASPIKIVETTGAGDAFSSGFISGIIQGKSIEDSLRMGSANSESVITHFGAKNKLLTRTEMVKYIKSKPKKVIKKKLI